MKDSPPGPALEAFVRSHTPLFVLTGAGLSTASGIDAYRGRDGRWQRTAPVQYRDFVRSEASRQRYWARGFAGWPSFRDAEPNAGHYALAAMERAGTVSVLVTQNVDGLHGRAGHQHVIDLHGRLDRVVCLDCGAVDARDRVQDHLAGANPWLRNIHVDRSALRADGDAELPEADLSNIRTPRCPACSGVVKPDVVFFGENVPRARVDDAMVALGDCRGVLVVGSSLAVYSGFRFCRRAKELGLPVAAINDGVTRADDFLAVKHDGACADALTSLARLRPKACATPARRTR